MSTNIAHQKHKKRISFPDKLRADEQSRRAEKTTLDTKKRTQSQKNFLL